MSDALTDRQMFECVLKPHLLPPSTKSHSRVAKKPARGRALSQRSFGSQDREWAITGWIEKEAVGNAVQPFIDRFGKRYIRWPQTLQTIEKDGHEPRFRSVLWIGIAKLRRGNQKFVREPIHRDNARHDRDVHTFRFDVAGG